MIYASRSVVLSPQVWGDIVPIRVDGQRPMYLGKHAYLAATMGIEWKSHSQGFKQALCEFQIQSSEPSAPNAHPFARRQCSSVDAISV